MLNNIGTFVVLGNMELPFDRLLNFIIDVRDFLPKPILIQGYNPAKIGSSYEDFILVKLLKYSEFQGHISNSKLVISHVGVGVIISCLNIGKVPIVFPRKSVFGEHINDHQVELCNYLMETENCVATFTNSAELRLVIEKSNLVYLGPSISLFDNNNIVNDIKLYLDI
jgi:UDP-N-acetylglucosamine transferase subunit ALG13